MTNDEKHARDLTFDCPKCQARVGRECRRVSRGVVHCARRFQWADRKALFAEIAPDIKKILRAFAPN